MDEVSVGGDVKVAEQSGITPELLDAVRPFLAESIMVLDHDWTIKANLAPPGGLIGRGLGVGLHTLEDMHPDDAILVMDLGMRAFSTGPGWQGSKIVRMRTGSGAYGRYEITAINCFDDPVIAGMVVRTRELPQDVTEHLTGIERTSAVETLAEMLPIGVLMLENQGRIVFSNDNVCGMLSREPEALKRQGLELSIDPDDRVQVGEIIARLTAEPGHEQCTIGIIGGSIERAECRFTSEGDPSSTDHQVSCVVITLEDVTARDATWRALEARANNDPLTGLLNRTALHEALQALIDEDKPAMVAYLDLDSFKAVNDTFGHERGDQLLTAIARSLTHRLGEDAQIARLGGDEFVIITDPGRFGYQALGAQLQAIVEAAAKSQGLLVSCSVGLDVAVEGDTSHDVLRRADHAMYAAKSRAPRSRPRRSDL